MKIAVLKEIRAGEYRVALRPEQVAKLCKDGNEIFVENMAGYGSGFEDKDYAIAGAHICEKNMCT